MVYSKEKGLIFIKDAFAKIRTFKEWKNSISVNLS